MENSGSTYSESDSNSSVAIFNVNGNGHGVHNLCESLEVFDSALDNVINISSDTDILSIEMDGDDNGFMIIDPKLNVNDDILIVADSQSDDPVEVLIVSDSEPNVGDNLVIVSDSEPDDYSGAGFVVNDWYFPTQPDPDPEHAWFTLIVTEFNTSLECMVMPWSFYVEYLRGQTSVVMISRESDVEVVGWLYPYTSSSTCIITWSIGSTFFGPSNYREGELLLFEYVEFAKFHVTQL